MPIAKFVLPVPLALFSLFAWNCFDYTEIVTFKPGYSGSVFYKYRVPVRKKKDRSIIGFLPISRERIERRIGREILHYSVEFSELPGDRTWYKRTARVQYHIRFKNPLELEKLLLGDTKVRIRDRKLAIERTFPVAKKLKKNSGRLERLLYARIIRSLEGHYMSFHIRVPPAHGIVSNLGVRTDGHSVSFNLPLVGTMTHTEDYNWQTEITAENPVRARH